MGNTAPAPCLHSVSHLRAREKPGGREQAAYQPTTISWAPKPFMTAEQSGFGTEVTAHTYQADNLIFKPLALLSLVLWSPGVAVPIFQRQTGAPTLLGPNRLDFPHCNVVSDTTFLLKLCSCVVKSLQCFSTNTF